jgi:hypothetical protein
MQRIREQSGAVGGIEKQVQFIALPRAQAHNIVGGGNFDDLRQHGKNDGVLTQGRIGSGQTSGKAAKQNDLQLCGVGIGWGLRFESLQHLSKSAHYFTYKKSKVTFDILCDVVNKSRFIVSSLRHRTYTEKVRCLFNLNGRNSSETNKLMEAICG